MTRTLLRCAAVILGLWAMGAQAQTAYPDRPIRLVIPYAPGGGTDATIRVLAGPMGEMLGQSVVIENRTGGAGTIGAAKRRAPDLDEHGAEIRSWLGA